MIASVCNEKAVVIPARTASAKPYRRDASWKLLGIATIPPEMEQAKMLTAALTRGQCLEESTLSSSATALSMKGAEASCDASDIVYKD